jgi:prepilin peptidase CpaA
MMPAMVPNTPQILADASALLALGALAAAALSDVARRRIPNRIIAVVALAGVARQLLAGAPVAALAAAGGVLLVATLFWLRGVLGGGDVKLLAASALLVPAGLVPLLLLATALAGGVLAALNLGLRGRVGVPARAPGAWRRVLRCEAWRIRRGAPMPYGVAIAVGAAFALSRPGA